MQRPDWLRIRHVNNPNQKYVEDILHKLNLNTVCREANCPNYGECFSEKTATFMIMGKNCTRNCRFCNVRAGKPEPLNPEEPTSVAQAVKQLGLKYVVITSVTRDDLPDYGAEHFAKTITAIKKAAHGAIVEILIPDFNGDISALKTVTDANPAVISHNMETVKYLYDAVRPQAKYQRSLDVLHNIKKLNPRIHTKSGIMVGLGEKSQQVYELFDDLREVNCEFLTIGQYLAPTKQHFPVHEYIEPKKFDEYKAEAEAKGFTFVASAPLVRSSYRASDAMLPEHSE